MASEEGDIYREIKADSKIRREEKQELAKGVLIVWARRREIDYVEIKPHQVRLSNDEFAIDIFPQHNKYHDLKTQKRGWFTDLIAFLSNHFQID